MCARCSDFSGVCQGTGLSHMTQVLMEPEYFGCRGAMESKRELSSLLEHQRTSSATDKRWLSLVWSGESTQNPTSPLVRKSWSEACIQCSGFWGGCPRYRFLSQIIQSTDGKPAYSGSLGTTEIKKGLTQWLVAAKTNLPYSRQTLERAKDYKKNQQTSEQLRNYILKARKCLKNVRNLKLSSLMKVLPCTKPDHKD